MDYEQKYKEALERAKEFHEKELYAECNGNLVEYIFPELKETEGDKIRKYLIHIVSDWKAGRNTWNSNEDFCNDIIAWLEKQKPEDKVEAITDGLETEFQKQVSCLIASAANREHGYTHGYVKWAAQTLLNYAKNELKPAEWSEEDKNLFEWTYINLTELKDRFGEGHGKVGKCLSWLKSLRPQSRGEDQLKLLRQSCVEHWEQRICMVKFETIKRLADNMYYAAQSMTTDASRLHRAMEEYRQFVINSASDGE